MNTIFFLNISPRRFYYNLHEDECLKYLINMFGFYQKKDTYVLILCVSFFLVLLRQLNREQLSICAKCVCFPRESVCLCACVCVCGGTRERRGIRNNNESQDLYWIKKSFSFNFVLCFLFVFLFCFFFCSFVLLLFF